MRLTDIGVKVVEFGTVLMLLGLGIEYIEEVAGRQASEAVRRHEVWEHRGTDEPNA